MALFGLIKPSRSQKPATPVMRELPVEAPPPPAVPAPPTPTEVRQMLFDAIASGDERRLDELCRAHREVIDRHAADWMNPPHPLCTNPDAAEWYERGVRLLTQLCTQPA